MSRVDLVDFEILCEEHGHEKHAAVPGDLIGRYAARLRRQGRSNFWRDRLILSSVACGNPYRLRGVRPRRRTGSSRALASRGESLMVMVYHCPVVDCTFTPTR